MSDIAAQFNTMLIKSGFQEMENLAPLGTFIVCPNHLEREFIGYMVKKTYLISKYMISIFTRMIASYLTRENGGKDRKKTQK